MSDDSHSDLSSASAPFKQPLLMGPPPLPAVAVPPPLHYYGAAAPAPGRHWFLRWAPLFATLAAALPSAGAGILYVLVAARRTGLSPSAPQMAAGILGAFGVVLLVAGVTALVSALLIRIFRGSFLRSLSNTYSVAVVIVAFFGLMGHLGRLGADSRKFDKKPHSGKSKGWRATCSRIFPGLPKMDCPESQIAPRLMISDASGN